MSESPFRPHAVDDLADRVEEHIGVRPVVTEIGLRHWEIRLAGEHVQAIGYYKLRPMDGRAKFIPGDLVINGTVLPPSDDLNHLRDLWKRHELGEVAEVPPLDDWTGGTDEVPKPVLKMYRELCGVEDDEDGRPRLKARLGREGDIWWVGGDTVAHEADERPGCIRFAFMEIPHAPGRWMPEPTRSVFIHDGMRTRIQSAQHMKKLLMELVNARTAQPESSNTGPIRQGSTATPGRANSVAARRASVRRV